MQSMSDSDIFLENKFSFLFIKKWTEYFTALAGPIKENDGWKVLLEFT